MTWGRDRALPGGLLRITIICRGWLLSRVREPLPEQFVTVEPLQVTRRLQFALEVDAVEYKRLEVSSPGIDRLCATSGIFSALPGR